MRKYSKWEICLLLSLLVTVVIILAAGAIIHTTRQSTEKMPLSGSNSKTYKANSGIIIKYPSNWYSRPLDKCVTPSSTEADELSELGLNEDQIKSFHSRISIPQNGYLAQLCVSHNFGLLAYSFIIEPEVSDNLRIGVFDLNAKINLNFPSLKLSQLGIASCHLIGFNQKDTLLYSCGKGDGPWWEATLFALNIKSNGWLEIEKCSNNQNEEQLDIVTCN